MRIRIEGSDLPGRRGGSEADALRRNNVHVGVQRRALRGAAQATADDDWITTNDLSRYALTEMARRRHNTPVESSEGVTEPIRLAARPDADAPADSGKQRTEARPGYDDAPFDVDQWRRLLTYYADCMQRAAVLQFFVDPQKGHTYIRPRRARKSSSRPPPPVRLRDRRRRLAEQARADGRTLQYGYPVAAVHHGRQPSATTGRFIRRRPGPARLWSTTSSFLRSRPTSWRRKSPRGSFLATGKHSPQPSIC